MAIFEQSRGAGKRGNVGIVLHQRIQLCHAFCGIDDIIIFHAACSSLICIPVLTPR